MSQAHACCLQGDKYSILQGEIAELRATIKAMQLGQNNKQA